MKSNYQLAVVGAGTAGVIAAIIAARQGLRVILIEQSYTVGGAATQGMVTPMMSLRIENEEIHLAEIDREIRQRMSNATLTAWINCEQLQTLLMTMLDEAGVDVLLGVKVTAAYTRNSTVEYLIAQGIAISQYKIHADCFIDCSGDAVLAMYAGVKCQARPNFDKRQAMTLRFEMANVDLDKFCSWLLEKGSNTDEAQPEFLQCAFTPHKKWPLSDIFIAAIENGQLQENDARYFQMFALPGKTHSVALNCPEKLNINSECDWEITSTIFELRQSIIRLSSFMIGNFCGFENSYISHIATYPGIRESRRIVGAYTLTYTDVDSKHKFIDAVAACNWYMDVHDNKNIEFANCTNDYYEIPYRTMYSDEIKNLLVAGRCISTDFLAQSSVRIQAVCRKLGESAALAAAQSIINHKCDVRKVIFEKKD